MPVCLDIISLVDFEIVLSLGVRPYNARQIASKMVDFPAPVGPDIAKIPSDTYSGVVKSMDHSPASELRFLNRS